MHTKDTFLLHDTCAVHVNSRVYATATCALSLLVGCQEERPASKKLSGEVLACLSVRSKVHVVCIWSSWYHCHPIISCFIKIQIDLTFWCLLIQVVLEQRPLNGCLSQIAELIVKRSVLYHRDCSKCGRNIFGGSSLSEMLNGSGTIYNDLELLMKPHCLHRWQLHQI